MQNLLAILLLEEDLNALYKIIFNTRMLPRLEAHHLIIQEIIGGRTSQSAMQLTTSKKLIADMYNQKKTPTLVINADTSNCCNRVSHHFAYLVAQRFGLNLQHILLLFKAMHYMDMFL